jgi:hypothetical protein
LKLGFASSISAGAILTLASRDARAGGSWQTMGPGSARAKGSWEGKGRVIDRHLEDIEGGGHRDGQSDGYVIPGSYEWRLERDEQKAEHDRMLGEFKRFGQ